MLLYSKVPAIHHKMHQLYAPRSRLLLLLLLLLLSATPIAGAKAKKSRKRKRKKRPGLGMVRLAGGTFTMGGDEKSGSPGTKEATLQPFNIDRTSVTNQMFRLFVRDTKYVTEAENFKWSFVFDALLSDATRAKNPDTVPSATHWRAVGGAFWRRPEGPDSSLKDRWEFPVVHISKADAAAYCAHYGLRLPTEEEWEFAARGGMKGLYPWGKKATKKGKDSAVSIHMMNTFQGTFPGGDTGEDGWKGVAPARAYEESAFGIYGMLGNVWEWTDSPFTSPNAKETQFVLKGGSFVDSEREDKPQGHSNYANGQHTGLGQREHRIPLRQGAWRWASCSA